MQFTSSDFDKICRICLEVQENLSNIRDLDIINMFESCTTVKVTSNDDLPPNICANCLNKLKSSFAFNEQCVRAYKQLEETKNSWAREEEKFETIIPDILENTFLSKEPEVPSVESDNDDVFDDQDTTDEDTDEEKSAMGGLPFDPTELFTSSKKQVKRVKNLDDTKCDRKQIKCLVCQKKFANLFCLARHLERHDENRQFVCHCDICNKGFYEKGHLTKHMRRHKGETRYQCEHCNKNFYELSALAVHMKIHKVDPLPCDQCGKKFMVKLQLEIHQKLHVPENVKCDQCDKTFKNGYYLKTHQATHVKERQYFCQFCDKSFKLLSALKTHHERNHVQKRERVVCNICGKSVIDLKSHERIHVKKFYPCPECPKKLKGQSTLLKHITLYHKVKSIEEVRARPHLCSLCGYSCISAAGLKSHTLHIHSNLREFKCHICENSYKTKSALLCHKRSHTEERNFQCDVCLKKFKTNDVLKIHKMIHTGEKPFVCNLCKRGFNQRQALKTHMRGVHHLHSHLQTHRPKNIFKCDQCPKEFRSKFNFIEHTKRIHNDEATKRPYLCSICGKGSITTTALKSHYQHIHSSEKPFTCSICGKTFKTEYTLNIHIRFRHNNERRHQCNICTKSFQTSSVLKLHMRVHTGERPYSCKMCEKSFGQSSALNTHLKKVHGYDARKKVNSLTESENLKIEKNILKK